MKLHAAERDLTNNLGTESQSFSIDMNAKAFQVLSNSLYSDKPLAVVREISCNAYDANPNRPFTIAAPSKASPQFVVRDYGPGLSHDDAMILYTTFFRSTKAQTNDSIGGFGLGSKAPLAYTDMFTVRSFQNGQVTPYVVFKNEKGIPQITPQPSAPTEEEDGLEVQVPIKHEDFGKFVTAIGRVLRYFPEGSFKAFGASPDAREVLSEAKDGSWVVLKEGAGWGTTRKSVAVMGPVAYPIEWNQVFTSWNSNRVTENYELHFPIGALDLAPSREALSYDKSTIAALQAAYKKIEREISEDVNRWAHTPATRWERSKIFADIRRTYNPVWGFSGKDYAFGNNIVVETTSKLPSLFYSAQELNKVSPKPSSYVAHTYGPHEKVAFVWNDVGGERAPRIAPRLRELSAHSRYLVFDARNWGSIEELCEDLGGAPPGIFIKLSSIEPPELVRSSPTGDTKIYHYNWNKGWRESEWVQHDLDSVSFDKSESVVYVPMNGPNTVELQDFERLKNTPGIRGQIKIWGLSKKLRKTEQLPPNFIQLDEYLEQWVEATLKANPDMLKYLAQQKELQRLCENIPQHSTLDTLADDDNFLTDDPLFKAYKKIRSAFWVKYPNAGNPGERDGVLHLKPNIELPETTDLVTPATELINQRPMFAYLLRKVGYHIDNEDRQMLKQALELGE